MMPRGHAIGEERSKESTQQAADALKDAAQQPEDAGQEATSQDIGPDPKDASLAT